MNADNVNMAIENIQIGLTDPELVHLVDARIGIYEEFYNTALLENRSSDEIAENRGAYVAMRTFKRILLGMSKAK